MHVFVPLWKEAPFLRLIFPFIAGIIVQWNIGLPLSIYNTTLWAGATLMLLFSCFPSFFRFRHYWVTGVAIHMMLAGTGGLLAWYKDIRHQENWFNHFADRNAVFIATVQEPLIKKNKSFKATASVDFISTGHSWKKVQGTIILYFTNAQTPEGVSYYSRIAFRKPVQPIMNSGNPGTFDYRRYCAFSGLYHQVFLKPGEYVLLPPAKKNPLTHFFVSAREKVLQILRKNLPGQKEAGLAEALLIGYKEDLDKTLVQSYANTGTVHIIAISGLHVGLIYWLLTQVLKNFKKRKDLRWVKTLLIISTLFVFSIVAGGTPSVLRSTVMFSVIAVGESSGRTASIYNSLAASAFLLLCFNPYWLWDAGFQLSYIAVLSIVIFMHPLYHAVYCRNKLLDLLWKSCAVCLAAQILTTPVSIYLFHQFPNYFLITNIVAVPLSSLVLVGEIMLLAVSFIPVLARVLGNGLSHCIRAMNAFIEYMEKMPYSVTAGLHLTGWELFLIYILIVLTAVWLLQKTTAAFVFSLVFVCCLTALRSAALIRASQQHTLIVYNVPNHTAIDIIFGRRYISIGNPSFLTNKVLINNYCKPFRSERKVEHDGSLPLVPDLPNAYCYGNKCVLITGTPLLKASTSVRCTTDVVIFSANPQIKINDLLAVADCKLVIADSSNPPKKINAWRAQCEKAGIPFYSVAEKGAFILDLN